MDDSELGAGGAWFLGIIRAKKSDIDEMRDIWIRKTTKIKKLIFLNLKAKKKLKILFLKPKYI